jgi:hypothetical protein
MESLALTGLIKIEFPTGDLRLCDGQFFTFNAESYVSSDPTFGHIAGLEPISEGAGDELPILRLVLAPAASAAFADLVSPEFQGSRVRMWISEYVVETGLLTGTANLMFDGIIDRPVLSVSQSTRVVEFDIISNAERLLLRSEGNSMSPRFHKSVWPGELGMDNAIDLEIPVAWGTESPARGTTGGGGSGIGRGGFNPAVVNV